MAAWSSRAVLWYIICGNNLSQSRRYQRREGFLAFGRERSPPSWKQYCIVPQGSGRGTKKISLNFARSKPLVFVLRPASSIEKALCLLGEICGPVCRTLSVLTSSLASLSPLCFPPRALVAWAFRIRGWSWAGWTGTGAGQRSKRGASGKNCDPSARRYGTSWSNKMYKYVAINLTRRLWYFLRGVKEIIILELRKTTPRFQKKVSVKENWALHWKSL